MPCNYMTGLNLLHDTWERLPGFMVVDEAREIVQCTLCGYETYYPWPHLERHHKKVVAIIKGEADDS